MRMRPARALAAAAALFFFVSSPASADTVKFKSGRSFEGEIVEESGDSITVQFSNGSAKFKRSDVKEILRGDAKPEENFELGPAPDAILPNVEEESLTGSGPETPEGWLRVLVRQPEELDFLTKEEILSRRKALVEEMPLLRKTRYLPSQEVFGQMQDKLPWWGTLGMSYYGPGEKSIEGPSEESRFVLNPFLLVGVTEENAHIVDMKLPAMEVYPKLKRVEWSADLKAGRCVYDLKTYLRKMRQYRFPDAENQTIQLVAYNAVDLGYGYLVVSAAESKNLILDNSKGDPVVIPQFIHNGGSCGYPGGCNNMSPMAVELLVRYTELPATIVVWLWKGPPIIANAKRPDMKWTIELTETG